MKKIESIKHNKIWGYEIWLYSPLKGMETKFEDGTLVNKGPLIKIIRADKPLSIQVHPDDQLAKELEGMNNGKSESWYIIQADKDAEMIIGLKNYDKDFIRQELANKNFINNLKTIKSEAGQFINVPAGLVHGIGAGNTVFEVQQPSDVTYRYYDYDRLENGQPRELHVEKSITCQKDLDWKLSPTTTNPTTYKNIVGTQVFTSGKTILEEESIVVDLKNYVAYLCQKGEEVNFEDYAIVSL